MKIISLVKITALAGIASVGLFVSCVQSSKDKSEEEQDILFVDAHNDVLSGTVLKGYDFSARLDTGNTDLVRLKEGKVNLQIFAVFGGVKYVGSKGFDYANQQIDSLYSIANQHSDRIGVARTVEEARKIISEGKIAGMIGLEGGHLIGESLDNLDSLSKRGIVYFTLTWNNSNAWATSSADEEDPSKQQEHKGLTDLGKKLIPRMNELGVAIDLSHVGEQAFYDAIELSQLPVLASHSNSRELCDVHRNLKDDQIKAIANTNGVVCVTFYAPFLDGEYYTRIEQAMEEHPEMINALKEAGHTSRDGLIVAFLSAMPHLAEELSVPISRVVDHIDHIVKVGGIDHVGIGSDFFGLSTLPYPNNLGDVTGYPLLVQELVERGYSRDDVRKIMGENVLRVLDDNIQAKVK